MSISDHAGAAAARTDRHESFLVYKRFRFLKIAVAAIAVSLALYIVDAPYGGRYGGTWAGYVLGTVAALIILWLTWFGYRKRSYLKPEAKLVAWLSAHVYLGLALIVIATLHTGFHFGRNVHTVAYVLMCLVIATGMFGVYTYGRYPQRMTENRRGLTLRGMLGRIASLDDELRSAALGVDDATAALVERSVATTQVGGSLWEQLSGQYPGCRTAAALAGLDWLDRVSVSVSPEQVRATRQLRMLLEEKALLLARARRDVTYKAMMEVWLYIHVPLSFALVAALLAHVIAVFYLW
ncbi:MAG TPA: hypothetical protein VGR91_00170 [Stellaceae bacterium]|nr:hypothetical protein [Stellaceae bacterium]HEV2336473.1 hypothetical protein [Stellaceae bacterium]